jgi:hypothetical protein
MSTTADLPASAVRDYRSPSEVGLDGINTPGMAADSTETWFCLLKDRTAFLNAVIGTPQLVGGPSGTMIRTVPLQHPEYPALYATRAKTRAFGYDADKRFWLWCRISVEFSSRPYALSGADAFLSINGSETSRQIPAPAVMARINGATPVYDPGLTIIGELQTITLHDLPDYAPEKFDALKGCTNIATFRNRPPGTVLYRGCSYDATSNFTGVKWNASHGLEYSPFPWNFGLNPDGSSSLITKPDGSTLYYPYADFSILWS